MDKTTLLTRIREAHAELAVAVDVVDDEVLASPAPGMDGWTRKDVLAHIEWWTDHSVRVVSALTAGREPYDRSAPWDLDTNNARVLEENRDRRASDVRRGEADAYRRLIGAVEAASEVDLFAVGRFAWLGPDGALWQTVAADSCDHYAEHLAQLRR